MTEAASGKPKRVAHLMAIISMMSAMMVVARMVAEILDAVAMRGSSIAAPLEMVKKITTVALEAEKG